MDPDNLVLTYERFIKDTEIVKFKNGTYEEITSHADTRKVMFQSRAKPTWDSVLTNLPEEVEEVKERPLAVLLHQLQKQPQRLTTQKNKQMLIIH